MKKTIVMEAKLGEGRKKGFKFIKIVNKIFKQCLKKIPNCQKWRYLNSKQKQKKRWSKTGKKNTHKFWAIWENSKRFKKS